jgi:hypothetical protein
MQKAFRTLLFWTLILGACSTGLASPLAVPPSNVGATFSLRPPSKPVTETSFTIATTAIPNPKLIVTVGAPHIDQPPDAAITTAAPAFEGCAYMWAYKDMPELSGSFQQSIQALQPEAQANAYTFGENCIHADESVTFLAKETDFNITVQVDDLSNESDLGEWIVKVMQIIENIPQEQIVGPQPGLVTLIFQSNGDQRVINFYINQYQALPSGLSHVEIYRALQITQ